MADSRPKEFKAYRDAMKYAKDLAQRNGSTRYVGPLKAGVWVVGTHRQLHDELGLEPLVRVSSTRYVRRKAAELAEIYTYWRNTGSISGTAKRYQCSESTVYRIIHINRSHK